MNDPPNTKKEPDERGQGVSFWTFCVNDQKKKLKKRAKKQLFSAKQNIDFTDSVKRIQPRECGLRRWNLQTKTVELAQSRVA